MTMRFEPYLGDSSKFASRSDMDKLISEGKAIRYLKEDEDGLHQGWLFQGSFYGACLVEPSVKFFEKQAPVETPVLSLDFPSQVEKVFHDSIPIDTEPTIKNSLLNSTLAKILAATIATSGGGFATVKVADLLNRIEVLETRTQTAVTSTGVRK